MPDRSYPVADNLIRRARRAAAGRPDVARILAQTISMACPGGADPYAVLGVLVEGTVQTLVEHIPKERRAEIAATLDRLIRKSPAEWMFWREWSGWLSDAATLHADQ